MANIFEISFAAPVRMVRYPGDGNHFDDSLHGTLRALWESRKPYYQKWQQSDTIKLPMLSSVAPTLRLYTCDGGLIKSAAGAIVVDSPALDYDAFVSTMALDDVDEGIYYLVAEAAFDDEVLRFISEPISVKETHPNTMLFRYSNSVNDHGIVFVGSKDGVDYNYEGTFRVEARIPNREFQPKRDRTTYRDQVLNTSTLSATPYRAFKLFIGNRGGGVAPWVLDLINFIICCDEYYINDKQFETPDGSEIEVTRFANYELVGGTIELYEAQNRSSVQQTTESVADGGIIVVYDLESAAFGPVDQTAETLDIQITDIDP